MRIDVVTIFPQYLDALRISLIGRATGAGLIDLHVHDLREWTNDRHRTVDDTPYGGGPGMVMSPEPWGAALDDVRARADAAPLLVIPTPSGTRFTQSTAAAWSGVPRLVFACGRYEGIDSRVAQHYSNAPDWQGVAEVSIGDYVLAGGEAAVLVIVEALGRLIPGVLGNQESAADDSFAPGAMADLVEGPVYTKPVNWRGLEVPEVLLSGHHGQIATWRAAEAERRTVQMRPDLLPDPPEA
jgi:tRNA (guanine37-N1)-methyltransferase